MIITHRTVCYGIAPSDSRDRCCRLLSCICVQSVSLCHQLWHADGQQQQRVFLRQRQASAHTQCPLELGWLASAAALAAGRSTSCSSNPVNVTSAGNKLSSTPQHAGGAQAGKVAYLRLESLRAGQVFPIYVLLQGCSASQ